MYQQKRISGIIKYLKLDWKTCGNVCNIWIIAYVQCNRKERYVECRKDNLKIIHDWNALIKLTECIKKIIAAFLQKSIDRKQYIQLWSNSV